MKPLHCLELVHDKNNFNFARKYFFWSYSKLDALGLSHHIFDGWEVQPNWKLQKNVWTMSSSKSIYKWAKHKIAIANICGKINPSAQKKKFQARLLLKMVMLTAF